MGYRLDSWVGRTPQHRRDQLAQVTHSLNDAPLGDLDHDDEVGDADRVECRDRFVSESGLRLHVAMALAPDGSPAGVTEVAVSADGTYGWQWNTGVDPAHRGRRLGLLLKAWSSGCASSSRRCAWWHLERRANDHMIAINDALGYVPVDDMDEWQLDL